MILENILNEYNKKLTFKLLAFFILSLPSFQYSSQMQNILISTYTPNFTCVYNTTTGTRNITISPNQCTMNVNGQPLVCSNWNFSLQPVGKTMVSDFNLVCDYRYFGDLILVLWYLTSLTSPIMGWFSDRFGRKKVAIFNLCLETISTISMSFTPNVASNIFFRICVGVSANGFYTCYVWLMEMVNNDFREVSGSFIWSYGCIAYIVFPLTAYLSQNWRITQLISLIPSILYISILFVPESPRWSCVMNRKQELMESLKKIAKINKIDFHVNSDDVYVDKIVDEHNTWKALKDKTFMFRVLIIFLSVFSINLLYSAVGVKLNILNDNIYISMFLLGLMEFPGILLSYFSLRLFKRKTSFILIGGTGSLFIFISIFFSKKIYWQSIIRIIFGCIAKVAITACNQSIMVYVSELCPTTHRSFGFASIQIANLVSFTAAIFINKLSSLYFFLPMLIYFIFMCSTCIVVYLTLPETKDLPIPETLFDQKMLKINEEKIYLNYMNAKNEMKNYNEMSSDNVSNGSSNEDIYLLNRKK